jgi:D-tyrosyl-tRNA(Tyr) deacylase
MIGLLQRVSHASVAIEGEIVSRIGPGLLVLVGVERGDGPAEAKRLAEKLVEYRVFPDDAGRMNRSVKDVGGELMLVPQFTLAADTRKGTRPGFSKAASPDDGKLQFERLVAEAVGLGVRTKLGRFGASMEIALTNVGPVTFWLRVPPGP